MIMNANKIFGIVLLGHICAVILIFFQPGCQSTERPALRTDSGTVPVAGSTETAGTSRSADPDVWSSQGTGAMAGGSGRSAPRRPMGAMEDDTTDFSGDDRMLSPIAPAPTSRTEVRSVDTGRTAPSGATYEVVGGDNLSTIARRHNVSLSDLMAANQLNRDSVIRPGDNLIIPAGGTASSRPASGTTGTASAPAPSGNTEVYVVQRGDTLSGIAAARGTTVSRLRELNGIRGDTIRVDQELVVPARSGRTASAAPTPSTSSSSTPRATGSTYTVQAGDTPGGIANRFGVSTQDLMRANNISDPRRMRVGQELTIPGAATRTEPAPTTGTTRTTPSTTPRETTPTTPRPSGTTSDRALTIPFGEIEDFGDDEDFPEVDLVPED